MSPAKDIERENILTQNEMIIAIVIPPETKDYVSYYFKQKEKQVLGFIKDNKTKIFFYNPFIKVAAMAVCQAFYTE